MAVVVKHAVIKSLPPEKLELVENLLKLGESYLKLAETVQSWGLLTDMATTTLQKALMRYAHDLKINVASDLIEMGKAANFSAGHGPLNAMAEAVNLFWLQKGRIVKMINGEEKISSGGVGNEIRTAKELLSYITQIQFETGALKRVPKDGSAVPETAKGIKTYVITEEGEKDALSFLDGLEEEDDPSV